MPSTQTLSLPAERPRGSRVAPWWLGVFMLAPHRRLLQNPRRILGPHVRAGQTVLEVGPGMGFFTLPLAGMVGERGRVVAVDCQDRMLVGLRRRAERRGLDGRIAARRCSEQSLQVTDLAADVDLVVAFNVVHEAADPGRMVGEMVRCLRPGGRVLLSEPRNEVGCDRFLAECRLFREVGLEAVDWPRILRQRTVVLERPADARL